MIYFQKFRLYSKDLVMNWTTDVYSQSYSRGNGKESCMSEDTASTASFLFFLFNSIRRRERERERGKQKLLSFQERMQIPGGRSISVQLNRARKINHFRKRQTNMAEHLITLYLKFYFLHLCVQCKKLESTEF